MQPVTAAVALEEVGDEQGDVLFALAERRDLDRHDVQPVEEVLAEAALLDLLLQVAVGRGDDAHVHGDQLAAADPLDLARLDRAEQLRLGLRAQVADLVEEEGAAVGQLELAPALTGRAGERATLMSEHLALDQVARYGGAVDTHEGAAAA